jgi:hypothetical protein
MKTLSVRQPWAFAILHLGKDIENRSWPTDYRGPLAIHASKRIDREAVGDLNDRLEGVVNIDDHELVTGTVVGIVDLIDCLPPNGWGDESPWAEPGQYHWLLSNPRPLEQPIPCLGKLGLFEVEVEK